MRKLILSVFVITVTQAAIAQQYVPDEYPEYVTTDLYPLESMPFCFEGDISLFPSSDSLPALMKGYAAITLQIDKNGKLKNFAIRGIKINDSLGLNSFKFENNNWIDIKNEGYTDTLNEKYLPPYIRFLYHDIEKAAHQLTICRNNKKAIKEKNYIDAIIFFNQKKEPAFYSFFPPQNEVIVTSEYLDRWFLFNRDPVNGYPLCVEGVVSASPLSETLPLDMKGFANIVIEFSEKGEVVDFVPRKIVISDESKSNYIKYENKKWKDKFDQHRFDEKDLPLYARNLYADIKEIAVSLKVFRKPDQDRGKPYFKELDISFNEGFEFIWHCWH